MSDCRAFLKSWARARYEANDSEDLDVTRERLRVLNSNDEVSSKKRSKLPDGVDAVMVKNLTKFYNRKKVNT